MRSKSLGTLLAGKNFRRLRKGVSTGFSPAADTWSKGGGAAITAALGMNTGGGGNRGWEQPRKGEAWDNAWSTQAPAPRESAWSTGKGQGFGHSQYGGKSGGYGGGGGGGGYGGGGGSYSSSYQGGGYGHQGYGHSGGGGGGGYGHSGGYGGGFGGNNGGYQKGDGKGGKAKGKFERDRGHGKGGKGKFGKDSKGYGAKGGKGGGTRHDGTPVGELVPEENAATKRECAGDFDLDAANKRFEKLEKDETPAGETAAADLHPLTGYDKAKSFFDQISCEATERAGTSERQKIDREKAREFDRETFGDTTRSAMAVVVSQLYWGSVDDEDAADGCVDSDGAGLLGRPAARADGVTAEVGRVYSTRRFGWHRPLRPG
ncbi:hypothetical protein AK812_SmicGene19319 [Symbiodinium microadriaticum]|uniref:FFD box profile domain-containing protein n=1 Tax=Symbiodinium microadriaticum TaxID=2951 RepID=A0A1Q9DSW3_SYMMI|nr:hypothetical protein AK812_SmicGene19319 [Symbiodinium microadriaticum]